MDVLQNIRLQKRKLKSILLNVLNVLMINPQSGNSQSPGSPGNDPALGGRRYRFILTGIANIRGKDTVPQAKPLDSAEKSEGKADSSRRGGLGMTKRGGANCLPALRLAGVSTGGRASYC